MVQDNIKSPQTQFYNESVVSNQSVTSDTHIPDSVWDSLNDLVKQSQTAMFRPYYHNNHQEFQYDTGFEESPSYQMASLPHSRSSTYSSSDSESSEDLLLQSTSLQEIRQEDLAAILPDHTECNDFNDFECKNAKDSPATGDMSGSDMELPQQAIKSLIDRTTESSSDGESHQLPNPQTLFANSLLQQFVAQTQVINSTNCTNPNQNEVISPTIPNKDSNCDSSQSVKSDKTEGSRKRRGRPKRDTTKNLDVPKVPDFCANPNVSPDSGIQNSPDHVSSPEPNLSPNIRQKVLQNKDQTKKKNETKVLEKEKVQTKQEKAKSATKIPVTSNQFDRVLYANSDRVLYPPRRKAGRPPSKKGPGRPQKAKIEVTTSKNGQKNVLIKSKSSKPSVATKNPSGVKVNKTTSLKVPKILHSKHKHKHKKRKFKILKPLIACDPKINQEIEKLVVDFVKFCIITQKSPKENVPDQLLKTIKKVTKKRRTTDHVEKKKKKTNVNTTVSKVQNSNEQRLPLKKRHYHLVSNSSETGKVDPEVLDENSTENPVEDLKNKVDRKEKGKSPKHNPPVIKNHINNNEYEFKEENHVDQAIEACIYKFSKNPEKVTPEKVLTTNITPKKRHRLENINSSLENLTTKVKDEENLSDGEKFKPKISVESFINELKIKRNLMAQKTTHDDKTLKKEDDKKKVIKKEEDKAVELVKKDNEKLDVQKTVQVSPESTKKKVRKRRAPNRTGFPTVKKKKKKPQVLDSSFEENNEEIKSNASVCDRVPKEGEEYTKFLERSSEKSLLNESDTLLKASEDLMSECESLPLEERTEFDMDDINLASRYKSKLRDPNDSNSGSELTPLESSIERLKSRLERKRNKDGKKLSATDTLACSRKRRRDDSPASSILSVDSRQSARLKEDRASASGDELNKSKNSSKKAPRWRKKFLVAGLFSEYYKTEEQKEPPKSLRTLAYSPDEHPYGLLPPPYHCGKYLRCRKVDFQLPYDLWWQHTHAQMPGRDVVPSWNYKKIRTNVYNVKSNGGACEPQPCNCKATSNCGDDCLNRLVFAECPADYHRCRNQRIQKHHWAPGIEKFMTEDKGWGVKTKEPIKQGEFILEYVGEVVSDQEFKERMNSIYLNDTHHYCLHLDGGLVIDGHRMGSDGRFVNHSCQPNCEMQKWSVNGQFRMALFALRDIRADEELTYDYNFTLFNPAEGQECKCASENCRGVIGGKTQRIRQLPEAPAPLKNPGRVGRPRKTEATKKNCSSTAKDKILTSSGGGSNSSSGSTGSSGTQVQSQAFPQIQVKPMSHQQKIFILEHHCFLLRNLTKVRKVRDRSQSITSTNSNGKQQPSTQSNDASAFISQLNALQKPRNMKTRKLAQVEVDPELNKTVKLAAILKEILVAVIEAKDEKGNQLSTNLMTLPSKRKSPEFFQKIPDPIDLSTIEQNIATGVYKNAQDFDSDMTKLFTSYLKFYGRTADIGVCATKLKTVYLETKKQSSIKFKDVLGEKPPAAFASNRKKNEEEDIIRCICGIPNDEGLMIQCERCLVWQHNECVKADVTADSYHCEICVPRKVDYEVPMDEFTEHGHRYFMTLMRGDLQLRQGDTVYVLRDIPIAGTDKKHTYQTIGKIDFGELDIFRIERLWKDKDTGKRFAYGHHYLRPHETYHEPTRKFFPNEVMRVPLYEAVPVELIMQRCWVMDVNTFCKGRPVGAEEDHVYICELRVDKGARMFSKASKSAFPICTKTFAFERFEERLKITRTYCPHEVDEALLKGAKSSLSSQKPCSSSQKASFSAQKSSSSSQKSSSSSQKEKDNGGKTAQSEKAAAAQQNRESDVTPVVVRTPAQQKTRLNKILLNLLGKMPTKQPLDVSYLLEGGRRRKKQDQPLGNTGKT